MAEHDHDDRHDGDRFYFDLGRLFEGIIQRLDTIEQNQGVLMSALTDAVERIITAFNANQTLLAQALAADAADQATIADLQAQSAAQTADVNTAIDEINAALPGEPDVPPAEPVV